MKKALPQALYKLTITIILVFFVPLALRAQLIYQPYSYQFYQKLDSAFYSTSSSLHTSLKPYIIGDSSALRPVYNALMNRGVDSARKSWFLRKLLNEHLFDVKNKEFTFYLDFLPDLMIGREFIDKTTTWLNTRGYQAGGTIGSKIFFYTSGYENQGDFANYLNAYVAHTGVVPGQAYNFNAATTTKDWNYVTALLGYNPAKSVGVEIGIDKTFVGDGYRSMLLSDFAQNYPLLRLKFDIGKKVQYMAMWAYLQDQYAMKFDSVSQHPPNRIKWGAFHYVDWTITNRVSLGFFNALIAPEAYDDGSKHGFDINYINPVLFVASWAPKGPIPDHTLFGFNGRYKLWDKTAVYAQFLKDQFASAGNSKTGYQLGIRGADLFKVKTFHYLFEYNTAKPYTYATSYTLVNYTELSEPLGHTFGANFKELVGILNYSAGRFDFQGELNFAKYGLNMNNLNYGKDLMLADTNPQGDDTGQGLNTNFYYAQGKVSYVINPKYNLRLEAGALVRKESNTQFNNRTVLLTFGLRSTFRDLYSDF
jgi:hypothetical protein